jgi:hypothetical protein
MQAVKGVAGRLAVVLDDEPLGEAQVGALHDELLGGGQAEGRPLDLRTEGWASPLKPCQKPSMG